MGIFLDADGIAITALATIAIAWFTFSLKDVTKEQAIITSAALKLAQDEFNATHRPKIRIRHIWVRDIQPGKQLSVDIVYANIGDAKAIIKSFGLDFNFIKPGGRLPGGMSTEQPNPSEYAECGLGETVRRDAVKSRGNLDLPRYTQLMQETLDLYCFGIVEYSDAGPDSTKKIKRTAFCRKFKKALEGEGVGRFVRFENPDPDYEYED